MDFKHNYFPICATNSTQQIHLQLSFVYRALEKVLCLIYGYFVDLFVYAIECASRRKRSREKPTNTQAEIVQNKTNKSGEAEHSD